MPITWNKKRVSGRSQCQDDADSGANCEAVATERYCKIERVMTY